MKFMMVLTLIFITLKLTGFVSFGWGLCVAPAIIGVILSFAVSFLVAWIKIYKPDVFLKYFWNGKIE